MDDWLGEDDYVVQRHAWSKMMPEWSLAQFIVLVQWSVEKKTRLVWREGGSEVITRSGEAKAERGRND